MGVTNGRGSWTPPEAAVSARAVSGRSAAVHTASTPGSARAAAASTPRMRACACTLRTTPRARHCCGWMSSTERPAPVTRRRASRLRGEAPIMAGSVYRGDPGLCGPVRRVYTPVPPMAGPRRAALRIPGMAGLLLAVLCAPLDARAAEGQLTAPSLAESWTVSKDGLVYEFVLRKNVRFHNGDPLSGEDVKFSFERYRGAAAAALKSEVARVEVVDPLRVRFVLKQRWPDFMTFYATPATGAAWIVPRKYVEKVGEDGFKKAPVGAGPYRFVSFTPGVELVVEAFDGYWRKPPRVKTLAFRVIQDESTRLAALKRGEVDVAYSITGPLAEELKRTPGLGLKPTSFPF